MEPQERRETILRAARELFSRHPYAGVSVAEIARKAGVSPPLVVFYYGSKQALYLAVVETAADSIREGLRALPGPASVDRLAAGVRLYAEYARTHRAGFLSLLRGVKEATVPQAATAIARLQDEIAAQILADLALTEPALTPDPATALAVRGYLGYVDAVVTHWLTLPDDQGGGLGPETIADLAIGAFTGGLAARDAVTSSMPPRSPAAPDPRGS
jgi:AcrR family transcriptional regulator